MSYGLLVEVRGNSEEVISVVIFLTEVRKVFLKMGVGELKKSCTGGQRGGFLRRGNSAV